ncbi:hypothetical protein KY290_017949 [Solanum tuberosum]|uniref:Uncharacterized protein n=1 Tax=Solanum tuberosum TaxID=4113 RepID=A0ABQ7VCT5_SOLTU|nr:hypothetical protein KY284_016910 [Solanum tuberosum]KAH0689754.1 hypothetical protein KY289_017112 [Solanum tuberosum]KAH0702635.1 hypothetical protein KY285_016913 [Solanum tuberosum]KAH0761876.1 hypothetical protein KY290_017949 [Solanum tuberosum]
MEMVAYPDLIGTMVKFWDSENMVFQFREMEMTPTIEEVLANYESVGMCNKRRFKSDMDLLSPKNGILPKLKKKCHSSKPFGWTGCPGQTFHFESFITDSNVQEPMKSSKKCLSQNKNGRRHVLLPLQYAYLGR